MTNEEYQKITTNYNNIQNSINNYVDNLNFEDNTYLFYGITDVFKYRNLISRKYVIFNLTDKQQSDFIDNNNVLFYTKNDNSMDISEEEFENIRRMYIQNLVYAGYNNVDYLSELCNLKIANGRTRIRKSRINN